MIDIILNVLDALVRGIVILALLAGALFLLLLLWDLMDPDTEEREVEHLISADGLTEAQRRSLDISRAMGFQTAFDYSGFGGRMKDRLGHCYMLASKAMLYIPANNMPAPAALIHGSWHGPTSENRIDHAVVLLDNGQIWEPITTGIYDRTKFEAFTRWNRHQIYSAAEARQHMMGTGTYGPW